MSVGVLSCENCHQMLIKLQLLSAMDAVYSFSFPAVAFWQLAVSKSHCSRDLYESTLRVYSICKWNYFAVVQIACNFVNAECFCSTKAWVLEYQCNFRHAGCVCKVTFAEGSADAGVHCCSVPCCAGPSGCSRQEETLSCLEERMDLSQPTFCVISNLH